MGYDERGLSMCDHDWEKLGFYADGTGTEYTKWICVLCGEIEEEIVENM